MPAPEPRNTSGVGDGQTVRGRGGFRSLETINTIPSGVVQVRASDQSTAGLQPALLMANYIKITPMERQVVFQYRIEFEPDVESVELRKRIFHDASKEIFLQKPSFDGVSDARSTFKTHQEEERTTVDDPRDTTKQVVVKFKRVGTVAWGSLEMVRLYNMHMKRFLSALNFFSVSKTGAYVHSDLSTKVGTGESMLIIRGFRTSANVHEAGNVLMNLEPCHKLMQRKNVLQYIYDIQNSAKEGGDFKAAVKYALVGKLVVTGYNKFVYRIEDVDFDLSPESTFKRKLEDVTYVDYFKTQHNKDIKDKRQPLLIALNNNKRKARRDAEKEEDETVKLVPELCNIAGMTNEQRADSRLKVDMLRATQVSPMDRINHMREFINKMHSSDKVKEMLTKWGYNYEANPVKIKGRLLPVQQIGVGQGAHGDHSKWPRVNQEANFDNVVTRDKLAVAPQFPKMVVVISRANANQEAPILKRIKEGFDNVGLNVGNVKVDRITAGDSAHLFVQAVKSVASDATAVLIILPRQDKEKYDAVKKFCTVERGLISQVVTAKLMMDDRKARGAATKIGIQIAAKVGGEPWRIHIPMGATMICGYDTYHDTSNRGRSFGAFVASMNETYTRWWSKADTHDKVDELSSHLSENVKLAMEQFKRANNDQYPRRIIIYRDGVSDGQLNHVFNIEVKQIKEAIKSPGNEARLAFVVVNKQVGARFYMKLGQKQGEDFFVNPSPGCVVDDWVTRQERFDFYLVSQFTRNGTVTPTYYNIIHEDSGLDASKHQLLAYKLCHSYFNWSGTVRVPSPCQYAHKLAQLCGEHIHSVPNSTLDDKLHFL